MATVHNIDTVYDILSFYFSNKDIWRDAMDTGGPGFKQS